MRHSTAIENRKKNIEQTDEKPEIKSGIWRVVLS